MIFKIFNLWNILTSSINVLFGDFQSMLSQGLVLNVFLHFKTPMSILAMKCCSWVFYEIDNSKLAFKHQNLSFMELTKEGRPFGREGLIKNKETNFEVFLTPSTLSKMPLYTHDFIWEIGDTNM